MCKEGDWIKVCDLHKHNQREKHDEIVIENFFLSIYFEQIN